MRLKKGNDFRAFNSDSGEYLMQYNGKSAKRGEKIADAWSQNKKIHLYVPPTSKDRMHFMIEKASELGIASYTPLITERAQFRKINEDKTRAWMIEAVEQSERFDIPTIHKPTYLEEALKNAKGTKIAAIERIDEQSSKIQSASEIALFIGPAGGWTEHEIELLTAQCEGFDLGKAILRSETAVIAGLSKLNQ